MSFLIDTGATVSIIPYNSELAYLLRPTVVNILSADGSTIRVHGEFSTDIVLHKLRRRYFWTFIMADTTRAILGADFLAHHKLLIDCGKGLLMDPITELSVQTKVVPKTNSAFRVSNTFSFPSAVQSLIEKYPNLIAPLNLNESQSPSHLYIMKLIQVIPILSLQDPDYYMDQN